MYVIVIGCGKIGFYLTRALLASENEVVVIERDARRSDAAIEDAIHVTALFNIYDRVADTLDFDIPDPDGFAQGADMLLRRGYA
jgi:Trk K+ transport system NAD-binding subunit